MPILLRQEVACGYFNNVSLGDINPLQRFYESKEREFVMYKIIYLTDSYDCETCGCNYAEGYQIYKDDELVVDKSPVAHCMTGLTSIILMLHLRF